jgi:hypothetical protein
VKQEWILQNIKDPNFAAEALGSLQDEDFVRLYHLAAKKVKKYDRDVPFGQVMLVYIWDAIELGSRRVHRSRHRTTRTFLITSEHPGRDKDARIASAASHLHKLIFCIMPQWFFDSFDESLIDDLFNVAKEEGGKVWWLKLSIVASQFVVKFAWRRFGQRKAVEKSSPLPKDQGDDEI